MARIVPVGLLALLTLALLVRISAGGDTAGAAFPGANGKIAFASDRDGNYEIYVMNADGSGQTNLTNNPADDHAPAWSPDGSRIAFQTARDGDSEIYVMNTDGSEPTRLTNNPASDIHPAWSPDGSQIVFTSRRDGNDEIYVMNADGSGQTRLTNNKVLDFLPAWSPDGLRIAFTHNVPDPIGPDVFRFQVYIMNADGTGQANLTNGSAGDWFSTWSPDGSQIAFTSARDDRWGIFKMNADGSGQTRLTTSPEADSDPTWSPDGAKIAFTRGPNFVGGDILVMNADGSE